MLFLHRTDLIFMENTMEIQWTYNGHTMDIQWTYNGHTLEMQCDINIVFV